MFWHVVLEGGPGTDKGKKYKSDEFVQKQEKAHLHFHCYCFELCLI